MKKVELEDLFQMKYSAFKHDFGGRNLKCFKSLEDDQ